MLAHMDITQSLFVGILHWRVGSIGSIIARKSQNYNKSKGTVRTSCTRRCNPFLGDTLCRKKQIALAAKAERQNRVATRHSPNLPSKEILPFPRGYLRASTGKCQQNLTRRRKQVHCFGKMCPPC